MHTESKEQSPRSNVKSLVYTSKAGDASHFCAREFSNHSLVLKMCEDGSKGRGVFYNGQEEVAAGTILLVSPHLGFLRFPNSNTKYCAECNVTASSSEWICCSFCNERWYCSTSCQKTNWYRLHQLECPLLGTPFYRHEPSELRCRIHLVRSYWLMLWCHRAQLDKRLWKEGISVSGLLLDTFNSLPSHSNSSYSTATLKEYDAVASLAQQELEWVFKSHPRLSRCDWVFEPTLTELIDTLKVFSSNNFSLIDSEMASVGEATFPVGSLINHSCFPNCMYSNSFLEEVSHQQVDGGGVRGAQSIISIRPILPGDEITVAYLDVAFDKKTRQSKLLENYHFHCSCDLCLQKLDFGLNPRDLNLSLYEELVPQACYLDWSMIASCLVKNLVSDLHLSDLMGRTLKYWIPGASVDELLKTCFENCSKQLLDISPKPSKSLHARAAKSLVYWFNHGIHSSQIAKTKKNQAPVNQILLTSGNIPLPTGVDTLVLLNKDYDPALPPANWEGNQVDSPAFYQTVGRLLSSSIHSATFHNVYTNPFHPVLTLRLIELGKLWFNLAPMLAPKSCSNEPWVLLSDTLALFYLTMALTSIPNATLLSGSNRTDVTIDLRDSWSVNVLLLKDLIKSTSGVICELNTILKVPV